MKPPDIRGSYDAQVVDIHPETYEVSVMLRNFAFLDGIKVSLGGPRQHPVAGEFQMPEIGDWGIVTFSANNPNSGIWITSRPDKNRNMVPAELLKADPKAMLKHHPGDQYSIQHGDGSSEFVWPDGEPGKQTMLKVTTKKDGSKSNKTEREKRVKRTYVTTAKYGDKAQRKPFEHREQPPVDVSFIHASGFKFFITADGALEFQTPKGIKFRISDSQEKSRSKEFPHDVTTENDQQAKRTDAGLAFQTQGGHKISVMDDPVQGMDARISFEHKDGHKLTLKHGKSASSATLQTKKGSKLELIDTPTTSATLKTPRGHQLRLDDTAMKLELKHQNGSHITMTPAGTEVKDNIAVNVKAPMVNVEASATCTINSKGATFVRGGVVILKGGGPNLVRTGDLAYGIFGPSICIGTSQVLSG